MFNRLTSAVQNRMPSIPQISNPFKKKIRPSVDRTLSQPELVDMRNNLKKIIETEFANIASKTYLNSDNNYVVMDIDKKTDPAFVGAYRNAIGGVVNNFKHKTAKTEDAKAALNQKMVEDSFGQLADRLATNIMARIQAELARSSDVIDNSTIQRMITQQCGLDINPVSTKFLKMDGIKIGEANKANSGQCNIDFIKSRMSELLFESLKIEDETTTFDKVAWTTDLKAMQAEVISVSKSSVEAFADVTRRKQANEAIKAFGVDPAMAVFTRGATSFTPGNIVANVLIGGVVGAGFGAVKHGLNEVTHKTNSETIIKNEDSVHNLDSLLRSVRMNSNTIEIDSTHNGDLRLNLDVIDFNFISTFDDTDSPSIAIVTELAYLKSFVEEARSEMSLSDFKTSPSAYKKFSELESKVKFKVFEITSALNVAPGNAVNPLTEQLKDLLVFESNALSSSGVIHSDNVSRVRSHTQNVRNEGIKSNNDLKKEVVAGMIKGGVSSALITARGALIPFLQDSAAYGSVPKAPVGNVQSPQISFSGAKSGIGNAVDSLRQSIPAGMPGHMDKLNLGDNVLDYDGNHLAQKGFHYESTGIKNKFFLGQDGNPLSVPDEQNIVRIEVEGKPETYLVDENNKIIGKFGDDRKLVDTVEQGFNKGFSIDKDSKLVQPAVDVPKPKITIPAETLKSQNPDSVVDIDKKDVTAGGDNHFGKTAKGEVIVDADKKPIELPKDQVIVTTKDGSSVVINKDTGEVVSTVNADNTISDSTIKQTYNPTTKELSTPDKVTPDSTNGSKTNTLDKPIAKDDLGKAPSDKNLEYRQSSNGKVVHNVNGEGIGFYKDQNVIENNGNQYVTEKDTAGNVIIKGKVNSDGLYEQYADGKAPVIRGGEITNPDGSKIEAGKSADPEKTSTDPAKNADSVKPTPEQFAVGKDVSKVEIEGKPYAASTGKHFEYTDDKGSVLLNEDGSPKEVGPNENVVELGKGDKAQIVLIDTKANKIVGMVNAGDKLNQPSEGKVFGFKDSEVVEVDPGDKAAIINQKELPKVVDTKPSTDTPSNKPGKETVLNDLGKNKTFDSEKFIPTEDKIIGEYTVKLPEGLSTDGIKNHQYFELNEVLGKDGLNKIPKGYHSSLNQEGTALLKDKYGNVSLFRKGEYPVYVGNKLMSGTTDAKGMGEIINKDRINYKLVAKQLEKVLNSNSGKASTVGMPSFAK